MAGGCEPARTINSNEVPQEAVLHITKAAATREKKMSFFGGDECSVVVIAFVRGTEGKAHSGLVMLSVFA